MSGKNGQAGNGVHTIPVASLSPKINEKRDTQITQGEIESLGITEKQREYITQKLDHVLEVRASSGRGSTYTDEYDWYSEFTKICINADIMEIPRPEARKHFLNPELLDVKPKPEPESNSQTNDLPFDEDLPFGNDPIEEVKEQLSDEAILNSALERHNASGISLYSSYITPDADEVLDGIPQRMAHKVYRYLAGNIELQTGRTHKRSRAELTEYFGICKRTWQRVEAVLRKHGLIEYHPDDTRRSHKQKVMFFLPHVADWYNNVQKPIKNHRRKTK